MLASRTGKIPLRIGITGTRGKTTVARLIGAGFRGGGFSVLTKTTGSAPGLILPDGREEILRRRGLPTLLEWKGVLKRAEGLGVQVLVGELMSVRPESLFVESVQVLKPHLLVITNARLDHMDVQGRTRREIARCFAAAIPPRTAVFVLEQEFFADLADAAGRLGSKVISVKRGSGTRMDAGNRGKWSAGFEDNALLAAAVTDHSGVDRARAESGFAKVRSDSAGLGIWSLELDRPYRTWNLVSLFAANDPLSTRMSLDRLKPTGLMEDRRVYGLLNLRKDRGDRTVQWLTSLEKRFFPELQGLILTGDDVHPAASRLEKTLGPLEIIPCPFSTAEGVMARLADRIDRDILIIGLANIGGMGQRLLEHWETKGRLHAV